MQKIVRKYLEGDDLLEELTIENVKESLGES